MHSVPFHPRQVMLCHFIACFWWAVGTNGTGTTWVKAHQKLDSLAQTSSRRKSSIRTKTNRPRFLGLLHTTSSSACFSQAGSYEDLSVDASYLVCLLWAISLCGARRRRNTLQNHCIYIYIGFLPFWGNTAGRRGIVGGLLIARRG